MSIDLNSDPELDYLSRQLAYDHELQLACKHVSENDSQWRSYMKPQEKPVNITTNESATLTWDFLTKCDVYGVSRPSNLKFQNTEKLLTDPCLAQCKNQKLPLFLAQTKSRSEF